ncbi:MAG: hypothetical protein Q8O86_03720 [Dehalococcoidia bacterium]|nr:hypothetical protein [Dehalococcoidia bacterium]
MTGKNLADDQRFISWPGVWTGDLKRNGLLADSLHLGRDQDSLQVGLNP